MEQAKERLSEKFGKSALAFVLACGLMLPTAALMARPEQAWATDPSVTINSATDNATGYKVYQIFTADISNDDKASNIVWNETFKATVLAYLDTQGYSTASTGWLATHDYTASGAYDNPQNAAEFIAEKIAGDSNDTFFGNVTHTPDTAATTDDVYSKTGASFARGLADALKSATPTQTLSVTSGTATLSGAEGYYLIVAGTAGIDDAGTAPIWLPLGGSTTAITEKTALPSVAKVVSNDSASDTDFSWAKAADANTNQDLWYRISATLPANLASFPNYNIALSDVLSDGLELAGGNTSSVKVVKYADATAFAGATSTANYITAGTDVTSSFSISYTSNTLSVTGNALGITGVNGDDIIAVYYQAHVVPTDSTASPAIEPVYGGGGNDGTVTFTYPSDPVYLTPTTATTQSTKTYSYQFELTQHDKSNGQILPGAKYTVMVSNESGNASANDSSTVQGKYVQADGSLGSTSYEFTSDSNGKILVQGVDAGIYKIVQTAAPTNYSLHDSDIYLTVSATHAEAGGIATFNAAVSGGETASPIDSNMVTRLGSYDHTTGTHNTADAHKWNSATGKVTFMTVSEKGIQMPLTGLPGYVGIAILGIVFVLCGFGGLFLLRRARNKRENL